MKPGNSRSILTGLIAAVAFVNAVAAQEAPAPETGPELMLSIELNGAAPTDSGCRLTFLVRNQLPADMSALSLETVILTTGSIVERLTLFDFGNVPSMRPRVRQFDLAGLDCTAVSEVLVNGVSACEGDGIEPAICLDALQLSSRTEMKLTG